MTLRNLRASWALLLASAAFAGVACNGTPDDGDGSGGSAEDGSGGSEDDGSGGSEEDGSGGSEDDGSGGVSPTGGLGGLGGLGGDVGSGGATGGDGSGGATGGNGSGGAPVVFEPITRQAEILIPEVDELKGLYVSGDGMVYASGFVVGTDGDQEIVVLRMNADGELDDSWGDFGIFQQNLVPRETEVTGMGGAAPVETVLNDGVEDSVGVVELRDGNVIVQVNYRHSGVGNSGSTRVALLGLDSAGEVNEDFGTDGVAPVTFGFAPDAVATWTDNSWGIKLDQVTEPGVDKVVVFGFGTTNAVATPARTDNDRYVTRVLADGSVDPTFRGGTAFRYNTTGTLSDGGRRGLVLDDGSIVSSGYTNLGEGLGNHIVLIKLTPAGQLDPTFGFDAPGTGVAWFNSFAVDGGAAECYGIAVQSTGRFLTTGYGTATAALTASSLGYLTSVKQDMVAFGVLDDGLDTSWGNDGHYALQSEDDPAEPGTEALVAERFEERGRDLVVLPDDRVVYAGRYDLRPSLTVGRVNGGPDETVGDTLSGRFVYDDIAADTSHFYAIAASEDRVYATTNYNAANTAGVLLAILRVGD